MDNAFGPRLCFYTEFGVPVRKKDRAEPWFGFRVQSSEKGPGPTLVRQVWSSEKGTVGMLVQQVRSSEKRQGQPLVRRVLSSEKETD